MKRSRSMVLTTIMATGGLSLAACDSPSSSGADSTWLDPQTTRGAEASSGQSYATLQECKAADVVTDADCDTAFSQAVAESLRFSDRQACEATYGVDQCAPRNTTGGGSFFTPLLTGFIVGQALNNRGGRGYYGNQGFRGDRDRGYGAAGYAGGGYGRDRNYVTGRSTAVSRGGFGGGGRGYGG